MLPSSIGSNNGRSSSSVNARRSVAHTNGSTTTWRRPVYAAMPLFNAIQHPCTAAPGAMAAAYSLRQSSGISSGLQQNMHRPGCRATMLAASGATAASYSLRSSKLVNSLQYAKQVPFKSFSLFRQAKCSQPCSLTSQQKCASCSKAGHLAHPLACCDGAAPPRPPPGAGSGAAPKLRRWLGRSADGIQEPQQRVPCVYRLLHSQFEPG